ncbi:transducin family protein [Actinidia rufa]|uniref:Transducin family protein n=1 Tax=Actinidia rufa TaxID=165716 RepID=A0A7J0H3G0_9ERIC|nr:transducin family protein [Actinidia rufa]
MTGRSSIEDSKRVSYSSSQPQIHRRVEAESLRNLSAKYCPLVPPPRSTIAAAFSPDGNTLASTHGDHTVKVIDCQTGSCLKVLSGHRRTPWVMHHVMPYTLCVYGLYRFDSTQSIQKSLPVEVWIMKFAYGMHIHRSASDLAIFVIFAPSLNFLIFVLCLNLKNHIAPFVFFKDRPIASIAFHAEGEVLAVASGHKVNDLGSSDSSMTRATSPGSLRYPPPAVYVANVRSSDRLSMATDLPLVSLPFLYLPSLTREDSRTDPQLGSRPVGSSHVKVGSSSSMQVRETANAQEHYNHMEMSPAIDSNSHAEEDETLTNYCPTGVHDRVGDITMDAMETAEVPLVRVPGSIGFQPDRVSIELRQHQLLHSRDPACWELPFLQGWLMGQSQAGMPPVLPVDGGRHEHPSVYLGAGSAMLISDLPACSGGIPMVPVAMPSSVNRTVVSGASGIRDHSLHTPLVSASDPRQGAAPVSTPHGGSDSLPLFSRIQSELAASLAATAAAELPCTVKLRIWPHDIKNPCDPLDAERCRLTIPHAVLCSEMGAHFSPCGRFLAACVACVLPQMEGDPSLLSQLHQDVSGAGTSPTRHPTSARQVMYELRIYSLEEATFGSVLVSRAIRAAHCLTSIQFSPTSEHILLAYGRRHSSLLKSIVINGETSLPIYTVLESIDAVFLILEHTWRLEGIYYAFDKHTKIFHLLSLWPLIEVVLKRESVQLFVEECICGPDDLLLTAWKVLYFPFLSVALFLPWAQVYRVSDIELVSVLPSAEDEVNVACFHPLAGGGLVYGTKEGKLRVLQYDGSHDKSSCGPSLTSEENMVEVEQYPRLW